jgi:hypothetical protein
MNDFAIFFSNIGTIAIIILSSVLEDMKAIVFWNVMPCRLVDIYQGFQGAHYSVFRIEGGGSRFLKMFLTSYETTPRYIPEESV